MDLCYSLVVIVVVALCTYGYMLFENRYISANAMETDQVDFVFALKRAWNVPVGFLYSQVLPGASLYFRAGSWSDLHRSAWERSVLLMNVFKHAGFRSESWEIGKPTKITWSVLIL